MFSAFWGEQQAAVAFVAAVCIFLSALARYACLPFGALDSNGHCDINAVVWERCFWLRLPTPSLEAQK